MTFAALPPEINSDRMYTGPGPGSMPAAATAWEQLAADLESTAISFQAVITGLIGGPWLGAGAATMAAAAMPYLVWRNASAGQAAQTSGQARAPESRLELSTLRILPEAVG